MPAADPERPLRLGRRTVYASPWVNLHLDRVRFPGGGEIDAFHVLDFDTEAVAVLVIDADDRILLIESFRYVIDSIEWELPAGGIEPGESVLGAARREVREETGYDVTDLETVYTWHPMNGQANKVFHLVRGRAGALVSDFDRSEVRSRRFAAPDEIRRMVRQRWLRDGYALTGVLLQLSGLV